MPILTPLFSLNHPQASASGSHLRDSSAPASSTFAPDSHPVDSFPHSPAPDSSSAHSASSHAPGSPSRLAHHLGALRALHLRNHLPADFSASHAGLVCSGVPVALRIPIVLMGARHVAHMWICITWRLVRGVRGVRDVGVRECGVGSLLPAEEEDDATDEGEEDCGASDGRSCNATRAER